MTKTVGVFLFSVVLLLSMPKSVNAWLTCPFGRINDLYPGQCELYVDTNQNEICDHSEPEGIEGEEGGLTILGFALWSTVFIIVFYFIHWYLVTKTNLQEKFKWCNQRTFRYVWNAILLLSFIPTVFTSFLWIIEIRNTTLSFWHYRAGIIFIVVATIHFLKRFKFFTQKP